MYETSDNRWFSLGSIEPHFYEALTNVLGIEEIRNEQHNQARWPEFKAKVAAVIKTKTADEWMAIMSQHDICAATVLEMENVVTNRHNVARNMVVELDSPVGKVRQIGVGPKLSDTPGQPRTTGPTLGQHTEEVLGALGLGADRIAELRASGTIG